VNPTPILSSPPAPPSARQAAAHGHSARWFRLFLAVLGLSVGLHAAETLERITLQLKWRHQFQFAGYYAAKEQGYYREAGLDVTILEADPTLDPVKAVTEGRAQYGVSNSGLLLARQQGQPVVVLAVLFQHSPHLLIARAESGIDSIHDLVGRRVMLEHHSEELLAYLRKEGVSPQSLQMQAHSFDSADLIRGKVDAISAYSSDEPLILDRAGIKYLTFTPRSAGIDFYGDNLFTTEAEIGAHPARVKAFREASLNGWKYAMQHPEEMIRLIHSQYGKWHDRDHLRFEARQMVPLMRPDLVEMGYMNAGRWQHIAETYAELGLLPPGFPMKGFLYDPDADDRLTRHRMKVALMLILPVAALLGALALVFLRLNRRLTRSAQAQAAMHSVLQENERRFRFIAEHSGDVIWTMDIASERFTYISPAVFQLLGFTAEELLPRPPSSVLAPESAALLRSELEASRAEWNLGHSVTPRVTEVDQRHRDGHLVPTEVVTTLHGDAQGRLVSVLGVSRDITERKRAEAQLRHEFHSMEQLASTDLLTGAWNRRRFEDAVEGEMSRSRRHGHPLSLLLLDIDHFKKINDAYGHAEGDRVLRGVAECVRDAIRVSDSLTRWGGEEFIVLMPNTEVASAVILAERIRECIAAHAFEGIGPVTASLGLAEYLPSASRQDWMERTDRAMYKAKHGGRNRVEIDSQPSEIHSPPEPPEGSFLKLVWKEAYGSGHSLIDAQHQSLFHLANELLDATLLGLPQAEASRRAQDLLAAVVQPFQAEAHLLKALNFPDRMEPAEVPTAILARAVELEQAFRSGALSVGDLFQFLALDVVAGHMLKTDREYFHLLG